MLTNEDTCTAHIPIKTHFHQLECSLLPLPSQSSLPFPQRQPTLWVHASQVSFKNCIETKSRRVSSAASGFWGSPTLLCVCPHFAPCYFWVALSSTCTQWLVLPPRDRQPSYPQCQAIMNTLLWRLVLKFSGWTRASTSLGLVGTSHLIAALSTLPIGKPTLVSWSFQDDLCDVVIKKTQTKSHCLGPNSDLVFH